MRLRLKFIIVLVVVFLLGLDITGYISTICSTATRNEGLRSAGVVMEAALSM